MQALQTCIEARRAASCLASSCCISANDMGALLTPPEPAQEAFLAAAEAYKTMSMCFGARVRACMRASERAYHLSTSLSLLLFSLEVFVIVCQDRPAWRVLAQAKPLSTRAFEPLQLAWLQPPAAASPPPAPERQP